MEDIIPIFILVLLLGEVPEVKAQLDMIVDFIEFDSCDLESERRLLLNFSVSCPSCRNPSISSTVTGRCDLIHMLRALLIWIDKSHINLNGRSADIRARLSQVHHRRRPKGCFWSLW